MACLAARNHILEPTPTKSCENEKQITLSGQFWSAGYFWESYNIVPLEDQADDVYQ